MHLALCCSGGGGHSDVILHKKVSATSLSHGEKTGSVKASNQLGSHNLGGNGRFKIKPWSAAPSPRSGEARRQVLVMKGLSLKLATVLWQVQSIHLGLFNIEEAASTKGHNQKPICMPLAAM